VFASALQSILSYKCAKNTSALGRMFATSHHDDVVRLVTAVWCPLEVPAGGASEHTTRQVRRGLGVCFREFLVLSLGPKIDTLVCGLGLSCVQVYG
jgi:hypothetical protein